MTSTPRNTTPLDVVELRAGIASLRAQTLATIRALKSPAVPPRPALTQAPNPKDRPA